MGTECQLCQIKKILGIGCVVTEICLTLMNLLLRTERWCILQYVYFATIKSRTQQEHNNLLNEEKEKILVFHGCHSQDGLGTSCFITQNGEAIIVLKEEIKKRDSLGMGHPLHLQFKASSVLRSPPCPHRPSEHIHVNPRRSFYGQSSSFEMEFLLKWALGMNSRITALVALGKKNDAGFQTFHVSMLVNLLMQQNGCTAASSDCYPTPRPSLGKDLHLEQGSRLWWQKCFQHQS